MDLNNSLEIQDYFKKKNSIKEYIIEVFKVIENIKIEDETNNKYDFVFEVENIIKTSTYLLIDYRILVIALLYFLEARVDSKSFSNIKKKFNLNNFNIHFDSTLNLLFILGKKELVKFNSIKKIYTPYTFAKYSRLDNYIVQFQGIALNYQTILDEFKKDDNELVWIKKFISTDYRKYHKKRSKKTKHYFNFENTSEIKKLSSKLEK